MTYPLLPFQQFVYDIQKAVPHAYIYSFRLVYDLTDYSPERLKTAFLQTVRNHPVFAMHFDDNGQTVQPYPDELNTPYFSAQFTSDELHGYIDLTINRILFDESSATVLLDNFLRAYNNHPLHPDNYLDYLAQFQAQTQADSEMLTRYGSLSCPVHPVLDYPLDTDILPQAGDYLLDLTDLQEPLSILSTEYVLSLDGLLALATMLAIADDNHSDQAAITWAYADRDKNTTAYIVGSIHKDIPLSIQLNHDRTALLSAMRQQMRFGIAHSNYQLTLTAPYNQLWNYAVNLLHNVTLTQLIENLPFRVELPDLSNRPASALCDIFIENENGLFLRFDYSATHYRPESIKRFAERIRQRLLWLIG